MEEDSLDDYIKLNGHKEEPKKEESKINSIITTTQKKRESEDRAIKIVELLIEGTVRPETFLKSVMYLNSMYYQDIVEERAIIKICGYPLCGKKIQPTTKKRYSISTKNNKVYDLNEYGYFCSLFCYNASNHIKNKLDDSPLWLREFVDIPTFNLLPKDEGHFSKGIDLKSKTVNKEDEDFTPVASFAEMSLDDFINSEVKKTKNNQNKQFKLSTLVENTENLENSKDSNNLKKHKGANINELETVFENDLEEEISNIIKKPKIIKEKENMNHKLIKNEDSTCKLDNAEKNMWLGKEKLESDINNILTQAIDKVEREDIQSTSSRTMTAISENILLDKITEKNKILKNPKDLKTLNEKIKNKFAKTVVKLIDPLPLNTENGHPETLSERVFSSVGTSKSEFKLKDLSLMRIKFSLKNPLEVENQIKNALKNWITLDTLIFVHGEDRIKEILDEKKLSEYFDNLKVTQLEVTQQKKYMDICKRLQFQEIIEEKWHNVYTGSNKLHPLPDYNKLKGETKKLDIKVKTFYGGMLYEADDSNFPIKETKENEQNEEGVPAVLPLVDVNSQNALRRRVLLNALNKGTKFFLDIVKYNSMTLLADLQEMVRTFKLNANNVIFKPIVWNYLGLICLKILAIRDADLRTALRKEETIQLENLILEQLPGKNEVVLNCLRIIENVDTFTENYIMS